MDTKPLNVKIILGSTRPGRFSEKVAPWVLGQAKEAGLEAEVLDLRDYPMPFFDEPVSPGASKTPYTNPAVVSWAAKIAEADAFIVIAPEYNHSYPAVLKNALDYLGTEWYNKPVGFVAYGSVGGARSVEQLRLVAVELQMAPIHAAVHISAPWNLLDATGNLTPGSLDPYNKAASSLMTQLSWWGRALAVAREAGK